MANPEQLVLVEVSAFVLGFVAAIPVGAAQLEIARRSLHGFVSSALMVVLGSVLSDTIYGMIAFFGVAPFLENPTVVAVFWAVNACILIALGVWVLRTHRAPLLDGRRTAALLAKHDVALFTGFLLSATNPLMIFWWLVAVRMLRDVGIMGTFLPVDRLLFLLAGACGLAAYMVILTLVVHRVKHFVSERTVQKTTLAFGILLLGLAVYFGVRSALAFL